MSNKEPPTNALLARRLTVFAHRAITHGHERKFSEAKKAYEQYYIICNEIIKRDQEFKEAVGW